MKVFVPEKNLFNTILDKRIHDVELRLDDGITITNAQRKKAYATIRDIADYTGYLPEQMKELMKYEYIIDLNGKAVPQELIRKGNENIWPREIEEGKYVIIDTYAITSDYIYASCVLKNLNYHLFYHIASKKTIMRPLLLNSINSIFPFTRPIVGATEQYLGGAIAAASIYDSFHERTEQEWLEKKGYCKGKVTNIGDNLIPFCKDLKMDDNPIILLYYFKK